MLVHKLAPVHEGKERSKKEADPPGHQAAGLISRELMRFLLGDQKITLCIHQNLFLTFKNLFIYFNWRIITTLWWFCHTST